MEEERSKEVTNMMSKIIKGVIYGYIAGFGLCFTTLAFISFITWSFEGTMNPFALRMFLGISTIIALLTGVIWGAEE